MMAIRAAGPDLLRFLAYCFVFMLALTFCTAAIALELNPQYSPDRWGGRELSIDPDFGLYGVPFDSTQTDVLDAFGDPQAIFVLDKNRTIWIYGRTHLLTFRDGRFCQVAVRDHALEDRINEDVPEHPVFGRAWRLKPGLQRNMEFKDIILALNKADKPMGAGNKIEFEHSTLRLTFRSKYENGETIFRRLIGFYITYHGGQPSCDCPC